MALISCKECNTDISDKAATCPKCGAPVKMPGLKSGPVVTTEQTGKKYKALQLAGAIMILAGVVSCTALDPRSAGWLIIAGLLLYIGARIGAWWNHG